MNLVLQTLSEVQEFLRLPCRELKSRQVKIHTTPLSNQIQNWEDVQKTLQGTSYESFLADYEMSSAALLWQCQSEMYIT